MNRRWLLLPAILLGVPTFMFAQSTPGTFAYTGSMSIPRNQATATLITGCNCPADGKVLVTGGVISSGDIAFTTNTAELYDPASGTFTPTGSMNVARSGQAAVLLLGGKVLIVGAFNAQGPVDAEIYDPVAGTFSCVAGLDPSTGSCNSTLVHNALSVTATMLQNGKVLIAGLPTPDSAGESSTGAALFDPSQSNFTCVSGMSSTPGICNSSMASFHGSGTATLLADGTVLVAGGFDPNSGYTNSAELYDPTVSPNGAFSITANLLTTRANHAAVLLKTGEVLIVGGGNENGNFNTAEVYANGVFASVGNMAHVRLYPGATLLNDGTVLVTGGCCEVSNAQLASAEVYNPTAKSFSLTGDMNEARVFHTSTLLQSGEVLVAGGFDSPTAELYTPVTPDAITSIAPTSGPQGQTITGFTVVGTNFDANAVLSFGGSGVAVDLYTSRTATQIIASITISSDAPLGQRDVFVINSAGQQAMLPAAFTVVASAPVTHTLTVASTTPNSGANVTAIPSDNNGQSSGTTQFALTYNDGAVVTLTAAPTASGNNFSNWSGCDSTSGMSCTVTMSTERTVLANYTNPCNVSAIQVDRRFANGVVNVSATGSGCDYTVTITNPKTYWTNFILTKVGDVTIQPVGQFSLNLQFQILAPGKTASFRAHFSVPAQAISIFVDPEFQSGTLAAFMNVLQVILDSLSLINPASGAGAIVIGLEDANEIVQAFNQMPHLTQLAQDLFGGRPNLRDAVLEFIAFRSSSEPQILARLLGQLGGDVFQGVVVDLLNKPGAVADFTLTLLKTFRSAAFEPLAGSILIEAR